MTIDELIAELHRRRELHGGSTHVIVTWESTLNSISVEDIYLGKDGALYIDGEGGFYKSSFQDDADKINDLKRNDA